MTAEMRAATQRIPESAFLSEYARTSYRYRGIIREGRRVVWTCEHEHEHRDSHVYYWKLVHGPTGAALTCAQDAIAERFSEGLSETLRGTPRLDVRDLGRNPRDYCSAALAKADGR